MAVGCGGSRGTGMARDNQIMLVDKHKMNMIIAFILLFIVKGSLTSLFYKYS
jgi:hypothetical protein